MKETEYEGRGGISPVLWAEIFDALRGFSIQIAMAQALYNQNNVGLSGWTLSEGTSSRIGGLNQCLKRRGVRARLSVVQVINGRKWWATNVYAFTPHEE